MIEGEAAHGGRIGGKDLSGDPGNTGQSAAKLQISNDKIEKILMRMSVHCFSVRIYAVKNISAGDWLKKLMMA
jgi:hypothetical protein